MDFKYTLNQRPPFRHLLLYGLQWLVVSIPNVLTVAVLGKLQFADNVALQTLYLQKVYVVMGITMLAQAFFGHRLPIVVGPAAVLIVGILSAASEGFDAVYTALATGGAVLFLLSVSGFLDKVVRIFTPRVIITILGLIAMTLAPVIINLVFSDGNPVFNFVFFIVAIVAVFLIDRMLSGIGKTMTVVVLTVGATVAYFLFNPLPASPSTAGAALHGRLFVHFDFNPAVVVAFLICFFALLINELGSIESVRSMTGAADTAKRTKRGCAVVGLGNVFSGLLGVIGPVDFSISPGIISSTRCASRYMIIPCGIGLLLCACFPAAVAWLTLMPNLVIGILLTYIIVLQLASAFNMIVETHSVKTFEHALTIALPLCAALIVAFMPVSVSDSLPAMLRPILTNGFVVGVLLVVFVEHFVFLKRN